ncbi:hypothetical protein HHI36_018514 [Cryptolaemus montrouzieri]|uniref:Uncharacterized protein n=1 Tax=Cryptolaemus montrouzieri TaxID=559131 RepID=A0ABD2P075_9CUCU
MYRHRNPKKLTYTELVAQAKNIDADDSDNSSDDWDYEPDGNNSDSDASDADEAIDGNIAEDNLETSSLNEETGSDDEKQTQIKDADFLRFQNNNDIFVPRFTVPDERTTETTLSRDMNEVDISLELFPKGLPMFITGCTNLRLKQFKTNSAKKRQPTIMK